MSLDALAKSNPVLVKRRGRRIELTPELIAAYGRAYDRGTQEMAAAIVGLSVRTINDWIAKAEEPDCDDEMLLLLRDTHNAVRSGGMAMAVLENLYQLAEDDPKIALELARVKVPGFAQVKHSVKDVNITMNKAPDMRAIDVMSDEELFHTNALARAKQKRLGE